MSEKKPLSDNQVHDRLHAAWLALGPEDGETARGDTSIKAARRALAMLQLGLVAAMEAESDVNGAIKSPGEPSTRLPSD